LYWAKQAIVAAGTEPIYAGKTSPWWYESDAFFELLKAAGSRMLCDLLAQDFDVADDMIDRIKKRFSGTAASLTFDEAEELLTLARSASNQVEAKSFSLLGPHLPGFYAKQLGTLTLEPGRGDIACVLPYTIEAWCRRPDDGGEFDGLQLLVNRTPTVGAKQFYRGRTRKADATISGCNLGDGYGLQVTVGQKAVHLTINVQVPYMPITSNGKEPDLALFADDILTAVESAARKCQRADPAPEVEVHGFLPSPLPKGRPSEEARAKQAAEMERFAARLQEITSTVEFKMSTRGVCYVLENRGEISKGDFDKAQDLITHCRKTGLLPIDFVAEDEARLADHLEDIDPDDPVGYADTLGRRLHGYANYAPVSFWDNQPNYIQVIVEKGDLKSLFSSVCREYHVPLINSRGWPDLNQRAAIMRRFRDHERKGRRPILLCCNDHDPVGLQIPERYPHLFAELEQAIGWSPANLTIERFGLNDDFIRQHGLTWIDGLETSGGKDLGDTGHRHHFHDHVQSYIAKHGKRKVEANALVVRPEAGRQLCREAIEKHLDLSAIPAYERSLGEHRKLVKVALPAAVRRVLAELKGAG
jgi:hypothetical protein